jgi:hypothetical protein
MTTINVQFADSTEQVIVSYFAGPQSAASFSNLGTVDTSDARYSTYFNSLNPMAQAWLPEIGS